MMTTYAALWPLLTLLHAPVFIEDVQAQLGDGTVLEKVSVVLDGGRIKAVGAHLPAPANAVHVAGLGKVLTPGLIEARTRLGLSEVDQEESANDFRLDDGPLQPAFRVSDGFNPLSTRIARAREEGITSAVLTPSGQLIYGTAAWFDLTGKLASRPDGNAPVAMVGGVGESAAGSVGGARGGIWLTLRQVMAETRDYAKNPTHVDSARKRLLSSWQLDALMPVVKSELLWVIEADRASDILSVLQFAKAERVRVAIAGGAEAWRVARELALAAVPVIYKPSVQHPASFEELGSRLDGATLLAAAGVKLILSAGIENQDVHRLRQEAGVAVAQGLDHAAALSAITSAPAALFGKLSSVGTITAGKRGNVVLWSGDPFETSTIAERVWIDGEEQSLDTRQRQLARRYHH